MTENKEMAESTASHVEAAQEKSFARFLPLIIIGGGAILGFIFLRQYLSLDTLRENREALLAWRDDNYLLAALTYVLAYVMVDGRGFLDSRRGVYDVDRRFSVWTSARHVANGRRSNNWSLLHLFGCQDELWRIFKRTGRSMDGEV